MDIKEVANLKAKFENEIAQLITYKMNAFSEDTGLYISDISIELIDVTQINDSAQRVCVSRVRFDVRI